MQRECGIAHRQILPIFLPWFRLLVVEYFLLAVLPPLPDSKWMMANDMDALLCMEGIITTSSEKSAEALEQMWSNLLWDSAQWQLHNFPNTVKYSSRHCSGTLYGKKRRGYIVWPKMDSDHFRPLSRDHDLNEMWSSLHCSDWFCIWHRLSIMFLE